MQSAQKVCWPAALLFAPLVVSLDGIHVWVVPPVLLCKPAVSRDVSTAVATLDAEYSVSEEESEASEALSEEVAATKQQVQRTLR